MDDKSKLALEGAKVELERLIGGWRPSADDLSNAPQIHDWQIVYMHGATRFLGRVTNHPEPNVGQKPHTLSSDILWIDENEAWAKTISRFYVLGGRAPGATPKFSREEAIAYACLRVGIEPPAFAYRQPPSGMRS